MTLRALAAGVGDLCGKRTYSGSADGCGTAGRRWLATYLPPLYHRAAAMRVARATACRRGNVRRTATAAGRDIAAVQHCAERLRVAHSILPHRAGRPVSSIVPCCRYR